MAHDILFIPDAITIQVGNSIVDRINADEDIYIGISRFTNLPGLIPASFIELSGWRYKNIKKIHKNQLEIMN